MPRRSNLAVAIQDPLSSQQDSRAENLAILRTQWRWAAFSQFFFTFFALFALNDVSVADIEQDLVSNTRQVLPRIMQKLLYALSYDRKVSVDNWQTALRKQYNKRSPPTNPIGPEPLPSIPFRKDVLGQDAERSISDQADDNDVPPNVSERGVSIINTVASLGEFTSAASTPLNDLNSTRQSSVVEERCAPRIPKDIDPEIYPEQKSIDWFDLPMLAKLESMHTVAEWQFQNPTKLRTIMKSDDEVATWRIEPIGYDSKGNAYWLIGADRLWIQRAQPKAPKSRALKRKKPPLRASEMKELPAQSPKKLRITSPEKPPTKPSSDRHSRAAKDQAKKRLDAQAKELARLNRQASSTNSGTRRQASDRSVTTYTPVIVGTRSSARLRGTQDDEWQPIPEEWLKEVNQTRTSRRPEAKTGLETDEESVSELTELSEDNSESPSVSLKWELNGHDDEAEADDDDDDRPAEQGPPSEDFVEWETICSTLQDWEHVAERFERATHYSEKALRKVLVNDIVPVITHELREIERKRHLEEAIVHRKRSSRIALRESEKEEARMSSVKKQEEEEKMSRARRLEARKQREEEGRIKREHAREQRRKEREEREEREETKHSQLEAEEALAQTERAAKKPKTMSPARDSRKTDSPKANGKDASSGSRTPVGEDWELACEICNRQGVNLDDGTPMMSCGICSRWQHIQCHDRTDRMAGRPRRNWNSEEFICSRCRATQRVQYNDHLPNSKVPSQNSRQAPPLAFPTSMPSSSSSIYHQDYRSPSHYLSGYINPPLQSQYGRPNGQQYPNPQYPSSLPGHSILSFSHYQPSQHTFLASAPNKTLHPNAQSLYTHTNNAFQQHRHDYVGAETSTWGPNAAQLPGNSAPISTYMSSQTDNHNLQPVHTYSNHEPQTSYTRYSTDSHSTGYKKPVPYPTSSRP